MERIYKITKNFKNIELIDNYYQFIEKYEVGKNIKI